MALPQSAAGPASRGRWLTLHGPLAGRCPVPAAASSTRAADRPPSPAALGLLGEHVRALLRCPGGQLAVTLSTGSVGGIVSRSPRTPGSREVRGRVGS